jgi:hypothetical protein
MEQARSMTEQREVEDPGDLACRLEGYPSAGEQRRAAIAPMLIALQCCCTPHSELLGVPGRLTFRHLWDVG